MGDRRGRVGGAGALDAGELNQPRQGGPARSGDRATQVDVLEQLDHVGDRLGKDPHELAVGGGRAEVDALAVDAPVVRLEVGLDLVLPRPVEAGLVDGDSHGWTAGFAAAVTASALSRKSIADLGRPCFIASASIERQ